MFVLIALSELDSLFCNVIAVNRSLEAAEVSFVRDEIVVEFLGQFLYCSVGAISGVATQYPISSGTLL